MHFGQFFYISHHMRVHFLKKIWDGSCLVTQNQPEITFLCINTRTKRYIFECAPCKCPSTVARGVIRL